MIIYKVNRLFGGIKRGVKMRTSDKKVRLYQEIKRYRRQWYWHETHWNIRHGITEE